MGVINPKMSNKNTNVSEPTVAITVEKTVSGLHFSSLAKRKSVVSIPNVNSTSINAV